jgi:hypothetical protein
LNDKGKGEMKRILHGKMPDYAQISQIGSLAVLKHPVT